jgi:uncharacterized RDD family membrane protein YckC
MSICLNDGMAALSHTDSVEYEDENDELITGEAVALDLRPAGFILRAAGSAIDFVLYFGSYILSIIVLFYLAPSAGLDDALLQAISIVGLVIFILVIPVTVELLSHGKSLGKLAVGVRIVRDDGGAIGLRHAAIRGISGVLEIFVTFGGGALVVGLLNSRAKRVGDLLAGTYAQHERIPQFHTPIYGVPVPLIEWARTADVARMPDALSRRIAQYLAQARGLSSETRARLGRQLANEASIYVSPIPEADAELFLAAVASLRRDREFAALQLEKRRLEQLRPVLSGLPHKFPPR